MDSRLTGKVIVVAGAGGIGDELARRYAGEGASVVLGDIDGDRAIATAEAIAATGATCIGTHLDGGDDASIKAMVDLAVSRLGGLDGFHANYAGFNDGEFGARRHRHSAGRLRRCLEGQRARLHAVHPLRHSRNAQARRRVDALHRVGRRLHGRAGAGGLCDEQRSRCTR